MKRVASMAVLAFLAFTALAAASQDAPAPNVTGKSVQGGQVDVSAFKGEKNVLLVFYRMHT